MDNSILPREQRARPSEHQQIQSRMRGAGLSDGLTDGREARPLGCGAPAMDDSRENGRDGKRTRDRWKKKWLIEGGSSEHVPPGSR